MSESPLNSDMFRERLHDLYTRHHGFVRRACLRYVQNPADADDLTHEVLVKAARGLPAFHGDCTTTTWLFRVAQNHCRDHARGCRRRNDAMDRYAAACDCDAWRNTESGRQRAYREENPGADAVSRSMTCFSEARDSRMPRTPRMVSVLQTARASHVLETLRAELQGPERHMIYLSFEVGMAQTGIARITGLPRTTVARRLVKIRNQAAKLYFDLESASERL